MIEIWTDGACSGNPGKGGWAAIILHENGEQILSGRDIRTTNNRMELAAVIESLNAIESASEILLKADSQYVVRGVNEWMRNWKSGTKKVKNVDLWTRLDEALQRHHSVTLKHVRAHVGIELNERADALAVEEARIARDRDTTAYALSNSREERWPR